jgi:hypothetical protein
MYDNNTTTCKDRIISLFKSHVRPIVWSKQNIKVEFRAKLGIGLDNDFSYINH